MTYANKDRRNATSAARKAKLGRTIDFDYVIPTGKNVGMTVRALFLDKMAKSPDKCWHWLGKLFSNGYGSFQSRGVDHLAHRVSFELFHGRKPSGLLMHRCDNKQCVNPAHLAEGTHADNHKDMVQKGRVKTLRGTATARGVLDERDILKIRARRAAGEMCRDIAIDYPVKANHISRITTGARHAHVKENKNMTPSEYIKLAMRTNNDMGYEKNLVHAAMLLSSESGEVASEVKRMFAYGKPIDITNVKAELGDVMWGIALMCNTLGLTLEEVMRGNIAKLEARYPGLRFDPDKAINRDTAAESEAINKVM